MSRKKSLNTRQTKQFYAQLSAWKRLFCRTPTYLKALNRTRKEGVYLKKDGTPSKRKKVAYQCADCGRFFNRGQIQVDHIQPVVPIGTPAIDMSWDEIEDRLFCSVDNLQVLCKKCHKKKSNAENKLRKNARK